MGQPIEHITQSNVFSVTYYLELDNAIIVLWVQTQSTGPKCAFVFENHYFFSVSQMARSSSKMLFKLNVFMVTFTVVLSTHMQNANMRSPQLIIKSNAQKQMARFGCGCEFHDLHYFELDFFFMFLEFLMHLRLSSNICIKNYQLNINFFIFIFVNHLFNIITCTPTCCIVF